MMAQFSVLIAPEGARELQHLHQDAGVRRREPGRTRTPRRSRIQEYRDYAGVDEGMTGRLTRFAFKILSQRVQLRHRWRWRPTRSI